MNEMKMTTDGDASVDATVNAGLSGAASDVVSRYGSGVKEHFVAYSGVDNETGQQLKRGLKQISRSKVNPEFKDSNLKQQAGFSAEVKEVARRRAEEAIAGKKPTTLRTDDIPGHVNDPLFDITSEVDAAGNPVPGSSAQMKFVGSSPKAAVGKMLGKDYQKYIDNNCKILVPSDYYDGMKADLGERISSLEKQVERLKAEGKTDAVAAKQAELDKCRKLDKNLQKSKVSKSEAMEARQSPKISTVKDVVKVSHRAGVEQAKMGAAIGGGISIVRNAVAYFSGDKEAAQATLGVARDTAEAAAVSYATGFAGAAIKGAAQNAAPKTIRTLATKTNLPAYIATTTLEAGKTLVRYFNGTIDGSQCLEELGEKGFGMVNSSLCAAIGHALIPVPVVGALAGSMIGYALSSASYKILSDSLKAAKIARERRVAIEAQCAESIKMLKEFRRELEANIEKYLRERRLFFNDTFSEIESALGIGDVDGYIAATNRITAAFGGKPQFSNMTEFDSLMLSEEPIIL